MATDSDEYERREVDGEQQVLIDGEWYVEDVAARLSEGIVPKLRERGGRAATMGVVPDLEFEVTEDGEAVEVREYITARIKAARHDPGELERVVQALANAVALPLMRAYFPAAMVERSAPVAFFEAEATFLPRIRDNWAPLRAERISVAALRRLLLRHIEEAWTSHYMAEHEELGILEGELREMRVRVPCQLFAWIRQQGSGSCAAGVTHIALLAYAYLTGQRVDDVAAAEPVASRNVRVPLPPEPDGGFDLDSDKSVFSVSLPRDVGAWLVEAGDGVRSHGIVRLVRCLAAQTSDRDTLAATLPGGNGQRSTPLTSERGSTLADIDALIDGADDENDSDDSLAFLD